MAIQLSSSYLRKSYQLLTQLAPESMSQQEAFERTGNIIYEWAKQKFSKIFKMPYRKETLNLKRDGSEIGLIYEPEKNLFIFRGVHPDIHIPGRIWTTDVEIRKNDLGEYIFAVQLSVTSLQTCTEEVPFSCPGFVRLIIENIGLKDVVPLAKNNVHAVATLSDVENFLGFLKNPARTMPVVLLTHCIDGNDAPHDGYMLNAYQMAGDLSGTAHVFQITSEANTYFTELIGKEWSAYNGAVRTYYPNVDLEYGNSRQHPFLTQWSIRLRNMMDGDPDAAMHEVEEYVQRYVLLRRIPWGDYSVEFYLSAYQKLLHQQNTSNTRLNDEISFFQEQIDQLQKQRDENLSLAASFAKDLDTRNDEFDQQRQQISRLKAQIDSLRALLKGKAVEPVVPIGNSYTDIPAWIDQYYPDRLFLHSRAIRSLKGALYEDVQLVYKCLKLLATDYYEYCTGLKSYDEFLEQCHAIDPGLNECGAITDIAAGRQGEAYYVQYNSQKHKLERHLTKGSSKDRRYCMRIYYFWSAEDQIIVIGDLPDHLPTDAT